MERKFNDLHASSALVIAKGIPILNEIACGKIVFNSTTAKKLSQEGEEVILVKNDIMPEDVDAINVANGILTSRNNFNVYIFTIMKALKKACIITNDISIDEQKGQLKVGNQIYNEGTTVSLDGNTGNIYMGAIPQHHKLGWNDMARQELKKRGEKIYSKVA